MSRGKKLAQWHPLSYLKVAGPVMMAIAFGWIGIRLLTDSHAAVVPGASVQLYTSPANTSVVQNQQFTVTVRVNTNGEVVNAVRADMSYDASQLEFVSTTSPCVDPPFGVTAENLPAAGAPTPGSIKVACGSFNGFSGDYPVAILTFKALTNTGSTSVSFANTSEALRKADSTNQLGSTTGATVTLTAPAPTVTSVSPTTGSTIGGTTVTIVGTNFVSTPTVKFGTTNATAVTLVNGTTVTATSPASSVGKVAVSVTVGSQTASLANAFTYADTTAPSKPGTPTVTSSISSKVTLNWAASTDTGGSGLAGYNIYRNGTKLNSAIVTGNSYTDTTAAAKTAYSYTVAAVDSAGNASAQSAAVSVTPAYAGDIDNNGTVNLTDLSMMLSNWGKTGTVNGDVDGNGTVNLTDLSMLLSNWGKS